MMIDEVFVSTKGQRCQLKWILNLYSTRKTILLKSEKVYVTFFSPHLQLSSTEKKYFYCVCTTNLIYEV